MTGLIRKAPSQIKLKPEMGELDKELDDGGYMDDLRITGYDALLPPMILSSEIKLSSTSKKVIAQARSDAAKVIKGEDNRLIVIVGPCSIHDVDAAMEYGMRLKQVISKYNNLVIIMRVYFEKPRTTVGMI
jgi:3-deoxy-7-phosphoheptulonate synthase